MSEDYVSSLSFEGRKSNVYKTGKKRRKDKACVDIKETLG